MQVEEEYRVAGTRRLVPPLRYPQHPAVVVSHLAGRTHKKFEIIKPLAPVNCPSPRSTFQATVPCLKRRVSTGSKVTLPDSARRRVDGPPLQRQCYRTPGTWSHAMKVTVDSKAALPPPDQAAGAMPPSAPIAVVMVLQLGDGDDLEHVRGRAHRGGVAFKLHDIH